MRESEEFGEGYNTYSSIVELFEKYIELSDNCMFYIDGEDFGKPFIESDKIGFRYIDGRVRYEYLFFDSEYVDDNGLICCDITVEEIRERVTVSKTIKV